MRAYQRKSVLVILDRVQGDVPARHGMAALAVGPELAAMDVSVAVRTVGADVLEDQAGMARRAGDLLVHAAQRIRGLVMVEFGIGPDGFPTGVRMAIGARRGQRTVRIGHFGLRTANTGPGIIRRSLLFF